MRRSRNRPIRRRILAHEQRRGPRPFVTSALVHRPDGTTFTWDSRFARKTGDADPGSTWWAPRARGWWIGVLFAIGSTCFVLGALPPYVDLVGVDAANASPRSAGWRIAALNLAGSVAFGISALGAFIQPTGTLANEQAAEVGTLVGAICFLAGGVLLLPERTATDGPDQPDTAPVGRG